MNNVHSPSVIYASKLLKFDELLESNPTQTIYTTDWFSNNIPKWNEIFKTHKMLNKPNKCLEIGSWEGRSACFILQTLCHLEGSELICMDTFEGSIENVTKDDLSGVYDKFCNNITLTGMKQKVKVIKGVSKIELPKMEKDYNQYFDFIYVDASHTATDALLDALNSFYLLRVGGIMMFDDYGASSPNEFSAPKKGIDTFLAHYGQKICIISVGYQLCIQRTCV